MKEEAVKIIVCVKQIVDLEQVRIKTTTRQPVVDGLPLQLSAFDKNALAEAVRIKHALGAHVTAVAVGSPKLQETIKEALAMGADEAVIVTDECLGGCGTAESSRVLAAAIRKTGLFDLVLAGEGSSDEYTGQVPSRLAELLGVPQITYVRQLEVTDGTARAVRDLERCLEVVEADLPVLVSVTGELNQPRLPTLTAILQAARKPLHNWTLADIGLCERDVGSTAATVHTLSNLAPQQHHKGVLLEGPPEDVVSKLVDQLVREGTIR